ncbi:hypothetical protein R0135_07720 [Congregibacter variabilis]|uniref:7-cyano-7-deazaguanine synthase n=1 Tax=Congregibacter variabilis TaxID=3081200 RepID=A0ABZ0I8H7_9GAMM|nr:hypothetical protein R0135_07720 [Congregibacter sp. IMCC43200]
MNQLRKNSGDTIVSALNLTEEPVRIFWTGGWDSTFQLLTLVFDKKVVVEPHYLIDEGRASSSTEMATMERLRRMIFDVSDETKVLLLPTVLFPVTAVPDCCQVTGAYQRIKKQAFLGSQYEWLARYCEYKGLNKVQLCIEKDTKPHRVIAHTLISTQGDPHTLMLDEQSSDKDIYSVFKYFDFPILAISKIDMVKTSASRGWTDFMTNTWFCHSPKRGEPCGLCNPCKATIADGLGWRVPLRRRLIGSAKGYVRDAIRKIKLFFASA